MHLRGDRRPGPDPNHHRRVPSRISGARWCAGQGIQRLPQHRPRIPQPAAPRRSAHPGAQPRFLRPHLRHRRTQGPLPGPPGLRDPCRPGVPGRHRRGDGPRRSSVVRAENAPENEGWADAQEHSASFHRAIVGLLGSPLLDEFYLNLMARLSTTFSRSPEPGKYHSHWANPHRDILEKIKSGDRQAPKDCCASTSTTPRPRRSTWHGRWARDADLHTLRSGTVRPRNPMVAGGCGPPRRGVHSHSPG